MLIAALVCMFIATGIFATSVCFTQKNKPLTFLLQTFSYISLLCLGFVSANYKNNFSGYAIFIIVSILPQFLFIFDFKEYLTTLSNKTNESGDTEKKPNKITEYYLNSKGLLFNSIALVLSAICLNFSSLYIGKESVYGFLIGIAFSLMFMFLALIFKKEKNKIDLLSYYLSFLAIGLLLSQIILVLIYSFNLCNALFSLGLLILAVFSFLTTFFKKNFINIVYFVSMFIMFITLVI